MSNCAAQGTNALQKGLAVLECLAAAGGRLTFTKLVRATGYPKGGPPSIPAALLDHGSLRLDREDDRYRFGWRVVEHARHTSAELDVVSIAQAELHRLHTLLGEVVYLALPLGREVLCSTVIGEGRPQQYSLTSRLLAFGTHPGIFTEAPHSGSVPAVGTDARGLPQAPFTEHDPQQRGK